MTSKKWLSVIVFALALTPAAAHADDAPAITFVDNSGSTTAPVPQPSHAPKKKVQRSKTSSTSSSSDPSSSPSAPSSRAKSAKDCEAAAKKNGKKATSCDSNRDHSWMNDPQPDPSPSQVFVDPIPEPSPSYTPQVGGADTPAVDVRTLPPIENTTPVCQHTDAPPVEVIPVAQPLIDTCIRTMPAPEVTIDSSERSWLLGRIRTISCPSPLSLDDPSDTYLVRKKIIEDLTRDASAPMRRAIDSDREILDALDKRAKECTRRSSSRSSSYSESSSSSSSYSSGYSSGYSYGPAGANSFNLGMGPMGYGIAASMYASMWGVGGMYPVWYSPYPAGNSIYAPQMMMSPYAGAYGGFGVGGMGMGGMGTMGAGFNPLYSGGAGGMMRTF